MLLLLSSTRPVERALIPRIVLDTDQLRTLLEPLPEHRSLLTAFLDSTPNDKLAWINDIAIDRYEHAREALAGVAAAEQVLEQKKVRSYYISRLEQTQMG